MYKEIFSSTPKAVIISLNKDYLCGRQRGENFVTENLSQIYNSEYDKL